MHSQKTEEDIYDFSGVSYDLTSLRSELMQFREKGKPATTDTFRSEETLRNDISENGSNHKKLQQAFENHKNQVEIQNRYNSYLMN